MGQEDQANIDAIHARLAAIDRFPDSYRDVVALSREVIQLYQDLLDNIGDREGFEDQGDGP